MNIILLSGGSGTRLWPLSNDVRSKQFIKIFRDENGNHESMVQRMYRLIRDVDEKASITIATSKSQLASIKNQLGDNVDISIEPCRRDTFPAIALSVAYLHDIKNVSLEDTIVVCPVDPLVEKEYFNVLKKLDDAAKTANLCLMGIEPTYPSDKYGYIIINNDIVVFREKPSAQLAKEYIKKGALWNGGVFAFKVNYLLEKTKKLCGTSKYSELFKNYEKLKKISFDYAIAEHEKDIKVIKYSGEWKDLGTWNTFTEAMKERIGGNAILGENCDNVHVINEMQIPIIGLGLKNMVIAATPDGILVSDKESSCHLKKYVTNNRPMFEEKIWGEYRVLDYKSFNSGIQSLTRELIVLPGKSIINQNHSYTNETYIITDGNGELLLNNELSKIKAGDNIIIKPGDSYSVKAIEELHIIDVQVGYNLTDLDIVNN